MAMEEAALIGGGIGGLVAALYLHRAEARGLASDLPTPAESGVTGYNMVLWVSLFAPAGTPRLTQK